MRRSLRFQKFCYEILPGVFHIILWGTTKKHEIKLELSDKLEYLTQRQMRFPKHISTDDKKEQM